VNIGNIVVTSLGNGRADIRLPGAVVFGEDPEISRDPEITEAFVTGTNSVKVRPIGAYGGFSRRQPVHTLYIEKGEGAMTKITATFKCDQQGQADKSSQER
jgi:hypothetical protein